MSTGLVVLAGAIVAGVLVLRPASGDRAATAAPSQSLPVSAAPEATAYVADVGDCAESDLECVTLVVPRDHANPGSGETVEIEFAVQRATGDRLGAFVTAVGGPGESGVAVSSQYAERLARIGERYDLVFFDQRGIGQSDRRTCPTAAAAYPGSWGQAQLAEASAGMKREARQFADECLAEMEVAPEAVHTYASWQTAEDLEAFREYLGDEQLYLLGESYGTLAVQAYAAAHPDQVAGLILDGPIDPQRPLDEVVSGAAAAFSRVLDETLQSCNADEFCAADVRDGDALAYYDELAGRLGNRVVNYSFPTEEGYISQEFLSLENLRSAAINWLYTEHDRMLFQRALAAVSQSNMIPMGRLAGEARGFVTEGEVGSYYAVLCADYPRQGGDPEALADEFIAAGNEAGMAELRLGAIYYNYLPCLYWPEASVQRPDEFDGLDASDEFPIFVLTATADPATPSDQGRAIADRTERAYLIEVEAGPHVVFQRGDPCVDDPVHAFLLEGELPGEREISCSGILSEVYLPILQQNLGDYPDLLEAAIGIDAHLLSLPELSYLDSTGPLQAGCDLGGTVVFELGDATLDITLNDCTPLRGFTASGTGTVDVESGAVQIHFVLADGDLEYGRDETTAYIRGTFQGQPIDLAY